jgi:hypothetical protein
MTADATNWPALMFILQVIQAVAIAVLTFYAWTQIRAKVNKAEIDALRTDHGRRLDTHGEKITRLEGRIDALPTHDDIDKLHGRVTDLVKSIDKVAIDVSAIGATVTAINNQVLLLNQHHMKERV